MRNAGKLSTLEPISELKGTRLSSKRRAKELLLPTQMLTKDLTKGNIAKRAYQAQNNVTA